MRVSNIKTLIKDNWILFFIFLLAISVRILNFNSIPEGGHLGWGYNFYGNVIKNFVDYGFIETKFGMVVNGWNGLESSDFIYYIHHPSNLFFILVSLIVFIFGLAPWVLKLFPLLFSMGSLILIYLIGKKFFGKKVGLIASFLFALVPLAVKYASHLDVKGPQVLFFILLTSFFYFSWIKTDIKKFYWFMVASFFIGSFFTSWTIYLLVPGIFIHNVLIKKKINKEIILFGFIVLISLCLFLLHVRILTGSFVGDSDNSYEGSLIHAYNVRSSNIASDANHSLRFTFNDLVKINYFRLYGLYTPLLLFLFIIWLGVLVVKMSRGDSLFREGIILVLLVPQVLYLILFKQSMWMHEFLWSPSLAGILISSSSIIDKIKFNKKRFWGILVKIFIFLLFVYLSIRHLGDYFNLA